MPTFYAWEATEASMPEVVHAVKVLVREFAPDSPALDGQTGDRDTETFCGRKVGQFADVVVMHARRKRGLLGYRQRYVTHRVVGHLRLRRREEVAHLRRCQRCLRSLHASWRVRQSEWRVRQNIPDNFGLVEWVQPLPNFPGNPVFVPHPAPAPFPTYYRYAAPVAASTTLAITLPHFASWLPTGATLATGTVNQWTWDFAQYGLDWHRRADWRFCATDALPNAQLPQDVQNQIAARRNVQQQRWMNRVRSALAHGVEVDRMGEGDVSAMWTDLNAMELVRDVCGRDAIASLGEHGWVDVESQADSRFGYRIRPWRRVGRLSRLADGSWAEDEVSYCIHPDDTFPIGDEVATLWMLLQFNEAEFLRVANVHRGPAVQPMVARLNGGDYLRALAEHTVAV